MIERKGNWMQTRYGRLLYFEDLRPSDIYIDDIAWSLSHICRFNGHAKAFYSVAQHSVLVSQNCKPENALVGLLDDSSEYALGDITRPLKGYLGDYQKLEKRVEEVIDIRFNLGGKLINKPADVKRADRILLATERRDLMEPCELLWNLEEDPLPTKIIPVGPEEAHKLFLKRWETLSR